jgi:hypothetical protein
LKTVVFTICTTDQHAFAKVLSDSLPKSVVFKVGVLDGPIAELDSVSLDQLGFEKITEMRQRYDNDALAAAAKPFFAAYFLRQEGIENVIYFDPTVLLLGDLEGIIQQFENNDILLTPRLTRRFGQAAYGDEKMFLNTGMYDAGFWGIRNTDNAFRFLNWAQDRLTDRALFDLCNGMNHDQLWLNYVPIYFDKVQIQKNIGWNVGLHNLHERILTWKAGKWHVNQDIPLIFFNFREALSNPSMGQNSGFAALEKSYLSLLRNYTTQTPVLFSVRAKLRPYIPTWKQTLRQQIQTLIDKIKYFPLYH